MGDASAAMPQFERLDIGGEPLPAGVTVEHIAVYECLYAEQCEVGNDL